MSNRNTIIAALTKATVATIEELADSTGWPERKVRDTISDLKTSGAVTAERDDVTGKAAYRLSGLKPAKAVEANHIADAGKKVDPVVKESLTTAKPVAKPAHNDDVSRLHERIADLESNNGQLELTVDAWMNLAGEFECKSIPDLRVLIGSLESRVVTLQMSVGALREQLDSKPVDAAAMPAATQFVVKTPNRPPRFTKKHSNAHAAAMSAARQHGFAEVFALVPVGKAVQGAEWRPK